MTATERRFVGGVNEAVEGFGGVLSGVELPNVVNDDEVAPADAGDHIVDSRRRPWPVRRRWLVIRGSTRPDARTGVDDGVAEGFDEVALAGARWAGDGQVLGPADPLEGAQRRLGGGGDGGVFLAP